MSPFTPGPWHICGKDRGGCICHAVWCDNHPICTVESGEWGDTYPAVRQVGPSLEAKYEAYTETIGYGTIDPEFAKGNVRLIAQAPAMLEFIQRFTAHLKHVNCITREEEPFMQEAEMILKEIEG